MHAWNPSTLEFWSRNPTRNSIKLGLAACLNMSAKQRGNGGKQRKIWEEEMNTVGSGSPFVFSVSVDLEIGSRPVVPNLLNAMTFTTAPQVVVSPTTQLFSLLLQNFAAVMNYKYLCFPYGHLTLTGG